MNEAFRLFVYGQLRRGDIGYRRLGLEECTRWLGPARVHGLLYDIGDYPAFVPGGEGIVHGGVLAFDEAALWSVLDDYEDCDPARPALSEYRRTEVDLLDGGRAWVYVYNSPIQDRPVIAGGTYPFS